MRNQSCGETPAKSVEEHELRIRQKIADVDAIWALEGLGRSSFTSRIAEGLIGGKITMEDAVQSLQRELRRRLVAN